MKAKSYIIPVLITILILAFMGLNFATAQRNNDNLLELGKINNTYHRANSCIITTDPSLRTKETKNACYDMAEKATGVKVDRFTLDK